jgi:hypothetical protein
VESGAPAEQMATNQRKNTHQEETVKNDSKHWNLGNRTYRIKGKSENQVKEAERRLVGEQERDCR